MCTNLCTLTHPAGGCWCNVCALSRVDCSCCRARLGDHAVVEAAINEGLATTPIDTWLRLIPQFIARLDTTSPTVRQSIIKMLSDIGRVHPQTLVLPLLVVSRSGRDNGGAAAQLLDQLRVVVMPTAPAMGPTMTPSGSALCGDLIAEAALVADELVRVSFLWHEQWNASLATASSLFFDACDIAGMIAVLEPLHTALLQPITLQEVAFAQAFGPELAQAASCMRGYCWSSAIATLVNVSCCDDHVKCMDSCFTAN